MKQKLSAVIVGQCAFTCLVVRECLQLGVRLKQVVIRNKCADADPFRDLKCDPEPQWLAEHRFYHIGWRANLERMCTKAGIDHVSVDDVFPTLSKADSLVVAGLAAKVPDRILSRFGDYALNVHPSLLPHYRGPQPEAQVILHGDNISGVSIHTMSSDFDSGPLRWQVRFHVPPNSNVAQLEQIEARLAANGIAEVLAAETALRTLETATKEGSYFSAYAPETLLNLTTCEDVKRAKRLIRLRPENYAFIPIRTGRVWIMNANGASREGAIPLRVGHDHLFVHQWIESSHSAPPVCKRSASMRHI